MSDDAKQYHEPPEAQGKADKSHQRTSESKHRQPAHCLTVCLAAENDTELGLPLNICQTCLPYVYCIVFFKSAFTQERLKVKICRSYYRDRNSNTNSLVITKMQTKPLMRYHVHQSDQQNYLFYK